jgi:hypothetical protein
MPDDHSEVVPLLPIPNRTVKRLSADDSAGSRVKVGHRQALTAPKSPTSHGWAFCFFVVVFRRAASYLANTREPRLFAAIALWARRASTRCRRRKASNLASAE